MHSNDTTRNTTLATRRHALQARDREQQERIFRRNALLTELYPDDRRMAYAAMAAQAPLAEGVSIEPVTSAGVRGWWIRPDDSLPEKAIFFVHGGGYHLGDARSYLGFASQIAAATRCAVFSVDYGLAPEHHFPVAYDDVQRALAWFVVQGMSEYVAVGDSAGGGLILATTSQRPTGAATLSSIVVFSPWTDLGNSGPSFRDPATRDPIFKPAVLDTLASSYLHGASALDPRASPLFGMADPLPPLYIQVGTDEILLDDSTRYAHRAAATGTNVRLDVFEGMHHVFQRDIGVLSTARVALDQAASFISASW